MSRFKNITKNFGAVVLGLVPYACVAGVGYLYGLDNSLNAVNSSNIEQDDLNDFEKNVYLLGQITTVRDAYVDQNSSEYEEIIIAYDYLIADFQEIIDLQKIGLFEGYNEDREKRLAYLISKAREILRELHPEGFDDEIRRDNLVHESSSDDNLVVNQPSAEAYI